MKEFLQWGCWITLFLTVLLWGACQITLIWSETSSPFFMIAAGGMFVINLIFTGTLFFTQGGPKAIRKLWKKL